jgi:integrase
MATRNRKPRQLTDDDIAALPIKKARYSKVDTEQRGLHIRVTPNGVKTFFCVARDPNGKQVWQRLGDAVIGIEKARPEARRVIKAIIGGEDRSGPQSYRKVSDEWFKRHVQKRDRKLRSATNIRRYLDKHILSAWGGRDFTSIKRSHVAELLDNVEDIAGPVAADLVLSIVRSISNWYSTRDDNYVSPVVRGMRRSEPKERARDRILDDDEIRAVWKQGEANGTFGAFVRLALLTAQRKEKVASMKWEDIEENVWHIPSEEREKGNAGDLELPAAAIEVIKAQTKFASNPYVLAGRGGGHLNGFSEGKKTFDEKVKIPHWTIHDLRRTARSLMSRAGVRPDIAERVMGHAIAGVEGIYDRHQYRDEKADALRRLAGLLDTIINPPVGNVVPLAAGR